MDCDGIRAAISASLDWEDPGLPGGVISDHLAGCPACREWQQRAHVLTRRVRLGGHALDHDLAPRLLAALPEPQSSRGRVLVQRSALLVLALAQLAVTVPLLAFGHDHDAGLHAAHELGCFDLALAIAFAVGAARPVLSAGLAWPCGIAALGLAGTAVADLIAGQAFGADEAQHLIAVAGAVLLAWQARTAGGPPAEHAPAAGNAGPAPAGDITMAQAPWPADTARRPSPGPGSGQVERAG